MKPWMNRRRVATSIAVGLILIIGFMGIRFFHRGGTMAYPEKAVYYCVMHPTMTSDHPADCPICSMKMVKRETRMPGPPSQNKDKGGRKILYWTDPMIPGYKSDKPGKSPMGMDLIPVYEEGGAAGGGESMAPEGYAPIEVTPRKQQLIGVKTAPAQKRRIHKTIRTVGQIAYDPELYQAEQEYLKALQALARTKEANTPGVAERSQELAEAARLRLQLLGISESFLKEIATWEGPDKSLLLADEKGRVWLYAPIYEFELPLVKIGQRIRMEAQAVSGKILQGTIQSIDPVLDSMTRTARVRALLTDPEKVLRPQMYVNAFIDVDLGEVVAVPQEAIFDTGTRKIAFVSKEQGMFEPREVVVGAKADGLTEVKQGIVEGEQVVINGNFLIDSESRLKASFGVAVSPTPTGEFSEQRRSDGSESDSGTAMKEHVEGRIHGH